MLPEDRPPTLAELIELRRAVPLAPEGGPRVSLAERFLLPPFSVLDARQGYWQKRKRMWLALGIQSELGRGETPSTSARVGPEDEATYRPIGGRRGADNGLLGESEQARSHYATPGGSPLEAATVKDGKIQRGDGRGRPLAQTYGSGGPGDLAAGFRSQVDARAIRDHDCGASHGLGIPQAGKGKGAHPIPGGSTGKNSAYLFKTADGYKSLKEIQEATGETPSLSEGLAIHTTADPVRVRDRETASLDGLTHGTTIHPYDGSSSAAGQSGTSIFDPVICELAYRWFCPMNGRILDPFAGGSVRGIVAAKLGRAYAGVDLRPEQAEANRAQAEAICPGADLRWVVGDSQHITNLLPGEYDSIISCPPYYDLERYSDDPRDLSTMSYERFLEVYRTIIKATCSMLKNDRFVVWIVGDVRDRATGNYRGFVGDTVQAFRAAGLELYNEAVLVTAVGSLPIRVGKQFAGYRKLGKTHQNVLVFLKGDAGRATVACGDVDVDDLALPEYVEGSVALCRQDAAGTAAARYLMGSNEDVEHVYLPPTESYLLCDAVRGRARAAGAAVPRCWLGRGGQWLRLEDNDELTYLVDGRVYLNRDLFQDAAGPPATAPARRRLRR